MNKLMLHQYMSILKENGNFFSEGDYNAAYVAIMYIKNNPEAGDVAEKEAQVVSLFDSFFEAVIE